jgi:hypothetical protein
VSSAAAAELEAIVQTFAGPDIAPPGAINIQDYDRVFRNNKFTKLT